jgi:transglutaminase-like putative cysteine protease
MQVGTIASLAQDGSPVMRIRFLDLAPGATPPQEQLYFRGPVLSRFDGRGWTPGGDLVNGRYQPSWLPPARPEVRGQPVRYEATLEPSGRHWLLVMDAAPVRPEGSEGFLSSELEWVSARPLTQVVRYRAASYPDYTVGGRLPANLQAEFTRLPDGFDPRTRALATELLARPAIAAGGTPALIDAALARLRTGGYRYTLDPGTYGRDTADEFWFNRKAGFCEHIASAFAVLMRAAGVPARIVTGYQGGAPNSVDGVWTVRQSDAHAWTEVWMAGLGWVRVDPTASVAPDRLSQFRADAPAGALGQAFGNVGAGFGGRVRAAWESINDRWNQWVLNYTGERQLDLLKRLGIQDPDWGSMARVLGGLVLAALLGGIAWQGLEQRRRDPWLRLYAEVRQRLARQGLASGEALPPRALARRATERFGDAAQPLADWLLRLEAQRYAPHDAATTRAALADLRRQKRSLRWPNVP